MHIHRRAVLRLAFSFTFYSRSTVTLSKMKQFPKRNKWINLRLVMMEPVVNINTAWASPISVWILIMHFWFDAPGNIFAVHIGTQQQLSPNSSSRINDVWQQMVQSYNRSSCSWNRVFRVYLSDNPIFISIILNCCCSTNTQYSPRQWIIKLCSYLYFNQWRGPAVAPRVIDCHMQVNL